MLYHVFYNNHWTYELRCRWHQCRPTPPLFHFFPYLSISKWPEDVYQVCHENPIDCLFTERYVALPPLSASQFDTAVSTYISSVILTIAMPLIRSVLLGKKSIVLISPKISFSRSPYQSSQSSVIRLSVIPCPPQLWACAQVFNVALFHYYFPLNTCVQPIYN